jgi:hypothetical protein
MCVGSSNLGYAKKASDNLSVVIGLKASNLSFDAGDAEKYFPRSDWLFQERYCPFEQQMRLLHLGRHDIPRRQVRMNTTYRPPGY